MGGFQGASLGFWIGLPAAVAVFIIVYRLFVTGPNERKKKFIARAERLGAVATARRVDSRLMMGDQTADSPRGRNPEIKCTYRYNVGGRDYDIYLTFQSKSLMQPKTPATMEVFYDPDNPGKSLTRGEIRTAPTQGGCFLPFLLAFLTLLLLTNLIK